MKVMFVGGGRRVSLAKRFIDQGFEVFSYETDMNCPINKLSLVINGKVWSDPDIKNHLENTINDIKPNLVLALSDKATPILSDISYNWIVVASKETNEICLNKQIFEKTLLQEKYYPIPDKEHPVILKPIYGFNSKGLIKGLLYNDYIKDFSKYEKTHIAQRQIISDFEISVDAYFDKNSKMIDAVPRFREEVQGGEVSKSITLDRNVYGVVELTKIVGEKIKLIGPVCVQFIIDIDDKAYIMEVNSRFGGGVVLSMEAGFNQIDLLKQEWIENKNINSYSSKWKSGVKMTRYFQEYFYE